jgi:hypothetical protein
MPDAKHRSIRNSSEIGKLTSRDSPGRYKAAIAAASPTTMPPKRFSPPAPHDLKQKPMPPTPVFRSLRGYAFDPSLATQLDTALVSEVIFKVPWEELKQGPIGEYVEVVDYDPASDCFYPPLDLNDPFVLSQEGLAPSEGNPQFHQQMVYAISMTTIRNFELALGRPAIWASRFVSDLGSTPTSSVYVPRLRIYPHALREANAYYSPQKKALLFGYFPASAEKTTGQFPGGMVFTCLSHDVVAHETTHALLDGFHRRFLEATNPDVLAFHEAFADIVALFQHFSFREVVQHQIARTRGDLGSENLLAQMATQVGNAIGNYGALRDAIGKWDKDKKKWEPHEPDPTALDFTLEPHDRGAILVAAVFDAFLLIYHWRTRDLMRIASGGSGVLEAGELHPDLVNRLAAEAAKSARHVLYMCIRALDYCPPVDLTFGEYLRAIITADIDLVPDDQHSYRVAFIEAFRRRGIYPEEVRTLAEDTLRWQDINEEITKGETERILSPLFGSLRQFVDQLRYMRKRDEIWSTTKNFQAEAHTVIRQHVEKAKVLERVTGLALTTFQVPQGIKVRESGNPVFEVHSFRTAQRQRMDGRVLNQVFISLMQKRDVETEEGNPIILRGGCTLVLDLDERRIVYSIRKSLDSQNRVRRQIEFQTGAALQSLGATYFGSAAAEPLAALHRYSGF